MFTVRESAGVVFVEEEDLVRFRLPCSYRYHADEVFLQTVRSLCSGYCTTFSSLGEVYAWLGEGSTDLERQACCEFAEAIADGRTVSVLAEGEETALFWHQMPDGTEYASANVSSAFRAISLSMKRPLTCELAVLARATSLSAQRHSGPHRLVRLSALLARTNVRALAVARLPSGRWIRRALDHRA